MLASVRPGYAGNLPVLTLEIAKWHTARQTTQNVMLCRSFIKSYTASMIKIKIIAAGQTKEQAYKLLLEKFQTMLLPYAQISWLFTKDFGKQKNQSTQKVRELESAEMQKALGNSSPVWILDEHGSQLESPQLAERLQKVEDSGETLTIIIGGTFGLSDELKKKADFLWSLSKLTLTHEMVRCVLLEQIYRATTINKGKNYHY